MNERGEEKKISSGWLNIHKPAGITSTSCLNGLKKFLPRGSKIGHGGTLDPLATGVLPIAVGEATKLISYIQNTTKEYNFTLQFGGATDTADFDGSIIEECSYFPEKKEIEQILPKFLGVIEQIPPKYSAIKVNSKRAYQLSREGKSVEIPPRAAYIQELVLDSYSSTSRIASFRAVVGKGTYIRTLAEDIAKGLKSLAYVIELHRSKVGGLEASEALDYNFIKQLSIEDGRKYLKRNLIDPQFLLADIPVINVDSETGFKIKNGRKVQIDSQNLENVAIKSESKLVAMGKIAEGNFIINRVFNF
jgi:tRNA pseudouridine55 synthase